MMAVTTVVTVVGKLNDAFFQQAKKAVEFLADSEPGLTANVMSLLPLDYDLLVQRVLPDAFPTVAKHSGPVLVYVGDVDTPDGATYIGGIDAMLTWCRTTYTYQDATHKIFYERLAKTHLRGYAQKTKREYVEMEIVKDGVSQGVLLIELFTDIAPRTCQNFMAFVNGTSCNAPDDTVPDVVKKYEKCPIHRVVKDGWFQTGDVVPPQNGFGGDELVPGKRTVRGRDVQSQARHAWYCNHGGAGEARQRVSIFNHARAAAVPGRPASGVWPSRRRNEGDERAEQRTPDVRGETQRRRAA